MKSEVRFVSCLRDTIEQLKEFGLDEDGIMKVRETIDIYWMNNPTATMMPIVLLTKDE